MLPWTLVDRAAIPASSDEIRLLRRGDEYSIRVANYELMSSRMHGSEESLAGLAFEKLGKRVAPRVLIGGLGMGYTLASVLQRIGRGGHAVVSELVPAVVQWNRGPLRALAGNPLGDRRVTVREQDVVEVIRTEKEGFDAILLDVDNGPRALTHAGNERLYGLEGLRASHAALRSRGVLAIWSTGPDPAFMRRLGQVGFTASEVRARARVERGNASHVIWLAQRGKI